MSIKLDKLITLINLTMENTRELFYLSDLPCATMVRMDAANNSLDDSFFSYNPIAIGSVIFLMALTFRQTSFVYYYAIRAFPE